MLLLCAATPRGRRIAIEEGACDVEGGSEILGARNGGELKPIGWPPSAGGRPASEPAAASLGMPRSPNCSIREGTGRSDERIVMRAVGDGERAYAFLCGADGVAIMLCDVLMEMSPSADGLPCVGSGSVEFGWAPMCGSKGTKGGNGVDRGFWASGGALDVE